MGNRYKPLKYVLQVLFALFPILLSAQYGPIEVNVIVKDASCNGYNDGKASASVTGGHPPYTYAWSNGQTGGVNNTGLGAGSYKVTITDAPGNKVVKDFTITQPEAIRIRADLSSISCGVNDAFTAEITGGTAPYNVSWKNVETGQVISGATITNPVKGSYIVEVTDSKGCAGSKYVNYNGPFTVSINTTNVSCYGSGDGSAEAKVSGGTMPYTYKWSHNGSNSPSVSSLVGGTYSVTVTDAAGCQKVVTGTVSESTQIQANLTTVGTCSNTGSAAVSPTGGRTPYVITWSNGATGNAVSNLTNGNYNVTITDASGCKVVCDFTIKNDNANLNVTPNIINASCGGVSNGSISLTIGGGSGNYTYKWSNGATTQNLSGVPAAVYNVTVTDASGCETVSTFTINNNYALSLTVNKTDAVCVANGSATAVVVSGGSAALSYQWSNGQTTATATNLGAGSYTVTATDTNGCSISNTSNPVSIVNTTSNNNLTIVPTISNASCGGVSNGGASLSVSGGSGNYTYKWSNGATTQNLTGVPAAVYNVTVTDASGCETVSTLTVNNNYALTLNFNKVDAVCGTNGSATAVVSGGSAALSYQWSNGQTSATASNLIPGNYYVTVTDANGCSISNNNSDGNNNNNNAANPVTISNLNNNNINIGATISDASCAGASNGAISISSSNSYTYKWSNGATSQSLSNVPAGTYNLTVSEGSCETVKTFVINNQNTLSVTVNKTDIDCNATGSVTAIVGGNSGAINYQWSSGQTSSSISNVSAGNYNVTVTDAQGCSATSGTVSIVNNAKLTVSLTKEDASCVGLSNGKVTAVVSCSSGNLNYKWNNGATTATIDNLPAGTYTVTVTSDNGTEVLNSTVNYSKALALTTTSAPTLCGKTSGSATVLTASGGSEPYTYKWSNGSTAQTAENLGEGTYSVTVTDAQGCQIVANNIPVSVQGSPISLAATPTNATCGASNGKVTLIATGGSPVYTYKIGSTSNTTGVFEGLKDGSYTATVTDAAGCKSTQTVSVQNTGNVQAAFAITPLSCEGNSPKYKFVNTSTGSINGAKYDWTFSGNQKSDAANPEILFNASPGEAILNITSAEGCTSSTKQSFPVDLIMATTQDQVTCQNTETRVNVINNTLFDYKYQWDPNSAIVSGGNTASPSVNTSNIGTTKLTVTITNDFGCMLKKEVNLNIIDKTFDPNKISIKQSCDSRKIDFTNENPNAQYYRWVFGDPANPTAGSTEKNPSYTYSNAGNYEVTLIPIASAPACLQQVKKSIPVSNGVPVSVKANDDITICKDSTIVLTATSAGNKLEWSNNPTFSPATEGGTFTVNPTAASTKYYVRATNAQGCIGTDEVVITNGKIQIQTPNRSLDLCKNAAGKSLGVVNLNPNDGLKVTWSPSGIVSGQVLNPTVTSNVDATLTGVFSNTAGCTLTQSFNITTHEVDAKATINKTLVYPDEDIALTSTPGTGTYTYKWLSSSTNGSIISPSTANTVAKPKENTQYTIEITDQFGCKDTAIVRVVVLVPQCSEPDIFVPRAFTPDNGDELNDKVFVRGEFIRELEFAIYNRWGELVFKTNNLEIGWDGTHKGSPVCPDVYGYYLKAICKDNQSFFKKGNITVLK